MVYKVPCYTLNLIGIWSRLVIPDQSLSVGDDADPKEKYQMCTYGYALQFSNWQNFECFEL